MQSSGRILLSSLSDSVVGDTSELTGKYEDRAKKYLQKLKAEQERALAKEKKTLHLRRVFQHCGMSSLKI